jgi:hypothetical protein
MFERIDQRITDPAEPGIHAREKRLIAEINSGRGELGLKPLIRGSGQDLGL